MAHAHADEDLVMDDDPCHFHARAAITALTLTLEEAYFRRFSSLSSSFYSSSAFYCSIYFYSSRAWLNNMGHVVDMDPTFSRWTRLHSPPPLPLSPDQTLSLSQSQSRPSNYTLHRSLEMMSCKRQTD